MCAARKRQSAYLNARCPLKCSVAGLLIMCCSLIFSAQAQAAEIYIGPFGYIYLDGPILEGDAQKFANFAAK